MRVLFDDQIFSLQDFGGISRYVVELMSHLPVDISPELAVKYSANVHLQELGVVPKLSKIPFSRQIMRMINRRHSAKLIEKGDFDVFHPTYYNTYYLGKLRRPMVVTVHDMIHERFPAMTAPGDDTAAFKRQAVEKADRVIAISNSTKRDLTEIYNIAPEKITVVHHGLTRLRHAPDPVEGLPKPYVLFVGAREGWKNFGTMLQAFAIIERRHPGLSLLCTGTPFSKAEYETMAALGLTSKVHSIFATDRQMPTIYAQAECFVFPSLYEGFGFPVLEAFSAHCPTAVSRTSSLPEVAADGALYFNPESADDIAAQTLRLLDDSDLRLTLARRGAAIADTFSWDRTARRTADVYRSLT